MRQRLGISDILPLIVLTFVMGITAAVAVALIPIQESVRVTTLPQLELPGLVDRTDIQAALPEELRSGELVWLSQIYERFEALSWVSLIGLMTCAYLPPLFTLARFFNETPIKARTRKLVQYIVLLSAIITGLAILASELAVIAPDQAITWCVPAMIWGAFVLSVFSDPGTQRRKWIYRLWGAILLGSMIIINLVQYGQVFASSAKEFEPYNAVLSESFLSGWALNIHNFVSGAMMDNSQGWIIWIWFIPFLIYSFIKDRIIARSPILHMVLSSFYLTLTIALFFVSIGVALVSPRQALVSLLCLSWIGMMLLEEFESTAGQAELTQSLLGKAKLKLAQKS